MKYVLEGDLIVGTGTGDIDGPAVTSELAETDIARLRFDGDTVIDVSDRTEWFADPIGRRHIVTGPDRTPLSCGLFDEIEPDDVGGWRVIDRIALRRNVALASIKAQVAAKVAAGAPAGALHVALDDGSRADMTAMGTTALAAASGALPWPASYALGWITIENIRIPLADPAAGLALAASVGGYYAAVVQNGRDLKDAVIAAVDEAALDALDLDAGWPNS